MEPYWFMAAMILIYPRLEGSTMPLTSKMSGRRNIDMVLGETGVSRPVDAT